MSLQLRGCDFRCFVTSGEDKYTKYAGLKITFDLCITLLFSLQTSKGNGGPASALESLGGKLSFHSQSLNIGLIYKQLEKKSFV